MSTQSPVSSSRSLDSPRKSHALPPKKQNFRALVVNCDSIMNKRIELENLVNSTDPDIIIMTESKLKSSTLNSEFLPPGYKASCKDRTSEDGGGVVMIATRDSLITEDVDIVSVSAEVIWIKVLLMDGSPLYVGAFYRQPSDHTPAQIDELEKSLDQIADKMRNEPSATVFLGGDFNAPDVDWESLSVPHFSSNKSICQRLLEVLGLHSLEQQQMEPTREKNILDLFCTNKPGLVKSCQTIPGISDHECVLANCNVKAKLAKKTHRKIFKWSKADLDKIRSITNEFKDKFHLPSTIIRWIRIMLT